MNYIEANLANDEKVVARIKHSWAGIVSLLIRLILLGAIGGVLTQSIPICMKLLNEAEKPPEAVYILTYVMGSFLILIGVVVFIAGIVEIKCAQLVVTNRRMFGRRGFIGKQTTDIMLSKVDTINAGNGFFGAIFHYGYIQIVSAATQTMARYGMMKYTYISNTMEFRKAVLEAIENTKAQEREDQAKAMRDAMKQNEEY